MFFLIQYFSLILTQIKEIKQYKYKMIINLLSFFYLALNLVKCENLTMKLINTTLNIDKLSFRLTLKTVNETKLLQRAIDQRFDFSWIYDQIINETLSNSSKNISTDENGTWYEEDFSFIDQSIVLEKFPIKVLKDIVNTPHSGCFGFSHRFENESYSIVHQLKEKGYINHLAYAFVPNLTGTGVTYFGGIPDEIRQTKKGGMCNVNTTKKKWSCELKRINFGDFKYDNKFRFHFQVGDEPIYAPFDFLDTLMKSFFKDYLASGNCSMADLIKDVVKCNITTIKEMPPFELTFDDYKYSLDAIDLFEVTDDKMGYFNVLQNPFSNNTWQIGITFLKHFDTLFDHENERIEFFSNTKTITYIPFEYFTFFIINSIMLSVGILLIVIIKCCCEKEEEMEGKNVKNKAR